MKRIQKIGIYACVSRVVLIVLLMIGERTEWMGE